MRSSQSVLCKKTIGFSASVPQMHCWENPIFHSAVLKNNRIPGIWGQHSHLRVWALVRASRVQSCGCHTPVIYKPCSVPTSIYATVAWDWLCRLRSWVLDFILQDVSAWHLFNWNEKPLKKKKAWQCAGCWWGCLITETQVIVSGWMQNDTATLEMVWQFLTEPNIFLPYFYSTHLKL